MEFRKVGWGDPALIYDEEQDLFRFRDGRFAFSREHADWALLIDLSRYLYYAPREKRPLAEPQDQPKQRPQSRFLKPVL